VTIPYKYIILPLVLCVGKILSVSLCPENRVENSVLVRIFGPKRGEVFWWGSLRERDHWGDPDVDGRIILRWIFRKWEGVVGTGWSGLRIGTGGGHL
jgi:hypothetical protein